jgi:N-acetylglucosamine-6-phosphate deacetylase
MMDGCYIINLQLMSTTLYPERIITPDATITNGCIQWDDDGTILYSGPRTTAPANQGTAIDAKTLTAVPGMIDMHVHGGFGITFGMGDLEENLRLYANKVAQHGVTGFIITISGPDPAFLMDRIKRYAELLERKYADAQPLGMHLEGPFLNPAKHGAFNPTWIREISQAELQGYIEAGRGWIKHVSLAPELEGSVQAAKFLNENGVRAALGHSDTDYEVAAQALSGDFTHVTHTFNAQSGLHHRQPGVIGAILTSEKVSAELIADGQHVHPAAMRILVQCLGAERVCLITDAMPGAGLPDGSYELLGQKVQVTGGVARLPDGTFAGSTALMDDCLRNMVKLVDIALPDAARMAATNPARVLGYENKLGRLAKGQMADIILLDESLQVKMTIKQGNIIYKD